MERKCIDGKNNLHSNSDNDEIKLYSHYIFYQYTFDHKGNNDVNSFNYRYKVQHIVYFFPFKQLSLLYQGLEC